MSSNRAIPETYRGDIYVAQSGDRYKIGFSRGRVKRRARDAGGSLLFTIPAGNQPSVLERIIHKRFKNQRVTGHIRCEWFYLTDADLAWLRGLSSFLAEHL